jgi:hypothetical protein
VVPSPWFRGRHPAAGACSYAPGAPALFVDHERFAELWKSPARHHLVIEGPALNNAQKWARRQNLHLIKTSGGNMLYSNQALR